MKSENDQLYGRIQIILFLIYFVIIFYLYIRDPVFSLKYCDMFRRAIPGLFWPASFLWDKGFAEFFTICIILSAALSVIGNIMRCLIFKKDLRDVRFENEKNSRLKRSFVKRSSLNFSFGVLVYLILLWQLPFGNSVIGDNSKIIYVATATYWFFVVVIDFLRSIVLVVL